MAVYTMSGWYLGNLSSIETDPNSLLTTFGSAGDILQKDAMTIDAEYNDTHLNDNTAGETITYDVGAGPVTNQMEVAHTYDVTIELIDGSTIDWEMVVIQSTDGETFALHSRDPELNALDSTAVESITFDAVQVPEIQIGAGWHNESLPPPCFCKGTHIRTPDGDRLVEDLVIGERITTLRNGAQPLLWVGVQRLDFARQSAKHMPIEFKQGSLAPGRPCRTLAVSPQHRMVIETDGRLAFGPANGFTERPKIRQRKSTKRCEYYALLLPNHEVIFAEGVAVESFLPNPIGLAGYTPVTKLHVRHLFRGKRSDTARQIKAAALPLLSKRETAAALRHRVSAPAACSASARIAAPQVRPVDPELSLFRH